MDEQRKPYVSPAAPPSVPTQTPTQPVPPAAAPSGPAGGPYAPSPYYYPQPVKKEVQPSDRRDLALAIVLALAAVLAVNLSLFGGFRLGFTIGYAAVFLCGAVYLRGKLRPCVYGGFCALAALAGAGVFVWHNDGFTRFLTFWGVIFMTMLALVEHTGTARQNSGTLAAVTDVLSMWVARPLAHFSAAFASLGVTERNGERTKRRFGVVLTGLLCAVPALIVLVPLLVHADAAFEGLMRRTVLNHLGEALASLLLGLGLFGMVFARLFSLRRETGEPAPAVAPAPRRGLDPLAVNSFLGVIVLLYAIYLFSQLAYFFSAFSGILPEEYEVAQYARRGFTEMSVISAINLLLVAGTLWLSRKREGKAALSTRILGLFILVFSLGLVAVSLSKMVLYIGSFGMTRLRILTSVFMLMLAALLIFVGIRMFAIRFPYMRATVVTVALLGLATAYMDVDTAVARYNVGAYRSGALEEMDVDTLADLSDGAVPYLLELCDDKDPHVAERAVEELYWRMEEISEVDDAGKRTFKAADFRAYNVDAHRARQLLMDNAEMLEKKYAVIRHDLSDVSGAHEDIYYEDLADYGGDFIAYMHSKDPGATVDALGYADGMEIYHAYDPDQPIDKLYAVGGYTVHAVLEGRPDTLGISVVYGNRVYTLPQAYEAGLDIGAIYELLPYEMQSGEPAWWML